MAPLQEPGLPSPSPVRAGREITRYPAPGGLPRLYATGGTPWRSVAPCVACRAGRLAVRTRVVSVQRPGYACQRVVMPCRREEDSRAIISDHVAHD